MGPLEVSEENSLESSFRSLVLRVKERHVRPDNRLKLKCTANIGDSHSGRLGLKILYKKNVRAMQLRLKQWWFHPG